MLCASATNQFVFNQLVNIIWYSPPAPFIHTHQYWYCFQLLFLLHFSWHFVCSLTRSCSRSLENFNKQEIVSFMSCFHPFYLFIICFSCSIYLVGWWYFDFGSVHLFQIIKINERRRRKTSVTHREIQWEW